jgi:hypothetical protein
MSLYPFIDMRHFLLAMLLLVANARAHHGLEFMILQEGTAPEPWSITPFVSSSFSQGGHGDETKIEGGMLLGLTHGVGLGVSTSYIDIEGADWRYTSTTPYLTLQLFQSDSLPWLRIGVYAGYQIAADPEHAYREVIVYQTPTAKPSTTSVTTSATPAKPSKNSQAGQTTRHTTGGGGGGGGPDAPTGGTHNHTVAAPTTSTAIVRRKEIKPAAPIPVVQRIPVDPYAGATGIHRHGEEGLVARLMADIDFGKRDRLVMNLINFTPQSGHVGWGYGIGWRHRFHHDLAVSVEATGDFDSTAYHEVLGAFHWSPVDWLLLKVGAGTGLGTRSSDFSLHSGLVLRF